MSKLSFIHRLVGIITVIAFLGTGQYLRITLPEPEVATHLSRMLARSAHVYLLLAGLINLALGIYLVRAQRGWRRGLQTAGSALLLFAPVLVFSAFVYEPPRASLERPLTLFAMIMLLAGTVSHLLCNLKLATKGL
jgi:choline-glycine betaine transporter